ncbi:hypothetical protein SAMN04488118_106215 [Epibacterium ulvae]|uniref:Uncharacterized protein n=1 Tax=Epibacterium ulvae TaxID=1156985 RepID=A0A1G5QXL0_9RHOB|nr:hypothetical protein [Epibacterium ulvae]SCZ66604.1 hypothetical protein SAMN04488118_106215 [Epibacterium ulvae]
MAELIVLKSTKLRVASFSIVGVCLGVVISVGYCLAIYPADHIETPFKVLFALFALASCALAGWDARKIWRIFKTPGAWQVKIGAGRLVWDVAIRSENLPLDIALADLTKALILETRRTSRDSDGAYTEIGEQFELYLRDGRILVIDQEVAGINPHRVFRALVRHGVRCERWLQDHTEGSTDRSRVYLGSD